jgi:hypothetical protein
MRNTTTCALCGADFPDADMIPMPDGGELCDSCASDVTANAVELFSALIATPHGTRLAMQIMRPTTEA